MFYFGKERFAWKGATCLGRNVVARERASREGATCPAPTCRTPHSSFPSSTRQQHRGAQFFNFFLGSAWPLPPSPHGWNRTIICDSSRQTIKPPQPLLGQVRFQHLELAATPVARRGAIPRLPGASTPWVRNRAPFLSRESTTTSQPPLDQPPFQHLAFEAALGSRRGYHLRLTLRHLEFETAQSLYLEHPPQPPSLHWGSLHSRISHLKPH